MTAHDGAAAAKVVSANDFPRPAGPALLATERTGTKPARSSIRSLRAANAQVSETSRPFGLPRSGPTTGNGANL
jgi:hypothetical protein